MKALKEGVGGMQFSIDSAHTENTRGVDIQTDRFAILKQVTFVGL
jgi:hypothetical protein